MGYLADQKAEHEKACEAAIRAGDAATARMHAAKAADLEAALVEIRDSGVIAGAPVALRIL